ncbi:MAG: hypothetical protein VW917_05195 [Pontimonas sp.]
MGYIAAGIAALGFRTEPGLALILQNLVLNFGVVTAVSSAVVSVSQPT